MVIYGYNTILTVSGSTLQNNGYDGVQSTGSNAGLTLSNSTINDNDQDGVEAGNLVNISGNIINHNGETGIQLLSTNGVITPAITNNTIISNTGDAIFVNYNNGAGLPILSNNIISGNRLNNGIALGGNLGINMTLPVGYPLTFVSQWAIRQRERLTHSRTRGCDEIQYQ